MSKGWSLDATKWQDLLTLEAKLCLRWKRCLLRPDQSYLVPQRPGVYVIEIPSPMQVADLDKLALGTVRPIRSPAYVGETGSSLRSRFMEHTGPLAQDRIRSARALPLPAKLPRWFIWTEIADYSAVQQLESIMIDCFNPPCNKIRGVKLDPVGVPAGSMSLR